MDPHTPGSDPNKAEGPHIKAFEVLLHVAEITLARRTHAEHIVLFYHGSVYRHQFNIESLKQ